MATLGSIISNTNIPTTGGSWDVNLVSTADQTANNAQNQDHPQLQFPVLNNELWEFRLLCGFSANNATGDGAINLVTTGTWNAGASFSRGVLYSAAGALAARAATAFASTTSLSAAPGVTANNGDTVARPIELEGMFLATANGTVKVQFGVAAAGAGRTATIHKGARLLARKVRTL